MTAPTHIIALRHGETDWNATTRIQGHTDIGLNSRGQWQAEQAAKALADEPITRIYASDLSRALHTAQAIERQARQLQLDGVQVHPGLRERCFGAFEGLTHTTIDTEWPEDARRWRQREPDFAPEGGESLVQLMARVTTTVNELAAHHPGGQIVVVAHGGVLDMLYRLATRQTVNAPRTWELGNTGINRLLWTPEGLSLVGWADTRHLETSPQDEFST